MIGGDSIAELRHINQENNGLIPISLQENNGLIPISSHFPQENNGLIPISLTPFPLSPFPLLDTRDYSTDSSQPEHYTFRTAETGQG